jgi:hypothetical protein
MPENQEPADLDRQEPQSPEGPENAQVPGAKSLALKKPVETLAMVPSEDGQITALKRKLYYALMWFAQQKGWELGQETFQEPLADVLEKINYPSRNMKHLLEALESMATTAIKWQSPTVNEGSSWGVSGMIAHAEIVKKRTGSTLVWSYSPIIRPKILSPHPYARGSVEIFSVLHTNASLALYDITNRYLTSATGLTPRRNWEWWKMVLTGSRDVGKQTEWKYFYRDTLKKALTSINANTSQTTELITHKVGTKVVDIQFKSIAKKNYTPPLKNINNESSLKQIGRAIALGISQTQAELFYDEHGEKTLGHGLDILEKRAANPSQGAIKKPKDYLAKVLDNQSLDLQTGALIDAQKELTLEKQKRLQLIEAYRQARSQEAWELFQESPQEDKAAMTEQFELQVIDKSPESIKKLYQTKSFNTTATKSLMRAFLSDQYYGASWKTPADNALLSFSLRHVDLGKPSN